MLNQQMDGSANITIPGPRTRATTWERARHPLLKPTYLVERLLSMNLYSPLLCKATCSVQPPRTDLL